MKRNKLPTTTPVLVLEDITKRFPGVLANDSINLDLYPQEIHAILGENGAGKTTLMNIVYGLCRPDRGRILVRGQEVVIDNPYVALRLGIGMVHQHFTLVPVMTVVENLMLGDEKTRGPLPHYLAQLDREKVRQEILRLSDHFRLTVDPNAVVENLSVGEAQRVEILKVLYKGAEILILDEPTAVLTPQEVDELFTIMRTLKHQGKSIIFITHKLNEVLEIADRITVLRQGRVVGTTTPDQTNAEELAALMVGHKISLTIEKTPVNPKDEVLRVEDLQVEGKEGHLAVKGANFKIRAGEIYGLAGVQGNGQTELVEALMGLRPANSGAVYFLNQRITNFPTRTLHQLGVAYVPEDRHKHGLVLPLGVDINLVLNQYYHPPFSKSGWLNPQAIMDFSLRKVREYDIRTPSVKIPVRNLSGGNQQKVIMARELSRPIRLLILNQPTRGLDVGSIEFIHKRILEARDRGIAILLISADLDEILGLSDRIGVMFNGRIVAEMPAREARRETLGFFMTGVHEMSL